MNPTLKACKFVNRLLPDLYFTVKPHNDQTWNAAVDRAKAYELTHQDQHAVNAYLNKFASADTNTQTEDLYKAIQDLTRQPGHIVKNCPDRNNNTTPVVNNGEEKSNPQSTNVGNSNNNQLTQIQQSLAQLIPQETDKDQSLN
ncbi:unnamed protein product [Rhizophagus irregularis]|nr:hypothetical protein RhiirB3_457727 [Rhizophagus irregularis]CAB5217094.1 unnamed protein product [Rhizophagus irregularis]